MAPKKAHDFLFKLLLIGDSGTRKTELLWKFSNDGFSADFISSIGIDFKIKVIELNGKKIKLQIWDTAGQGRFHTITTSYFRGAKGVLLVYDVTNDQSFKNIPKWIQHIEEYAQEGTEVILIGNNCDQVDKRQVTTEQGFELAKAHNFQFLETSIESNINVEKAFLDLTKAIFNKSC